ncbi:DUF3095 family protein [Nonlabens dokdonensis]|jgi:hypothetical protein|nr:DUF3095 family protein [Nonlabens dokdonensis]
MQSTHHTFYQDLHLHYGKLHELVADEQVFSKVPDSWNIIVTDVENSTKAISEGKQQVVNLAATGSIVACLNISREAGIEIPFFFGGDGATIIVPDEILEECLFALQLHQERCSISFEFYLRVGHRKVGAMIENGGSLKILKYKRNDLHIMPIILGDALQMAEDAIKSNKQEITAKDLPYNLNLEGMECKWDKIKPPRNENEILTLIIQATTVAHQSKVYSKVLKKIDEIYGEDVIRHPITAKRLKMVHKLSRLKDEVKMKFDQITTTKLAASWWRTVMGSWFTKYTSSGRNYLNDLIQLTETLLLDGAINTVISGKQSQREQLLDYLDRLEDNGSIVYGFYCSTSSILSCFVTAIDDYHIHFLDGDNGGYTQASKVLKPKLRRQQLSE